MAAISAFGSAGCERNSRYIYVAKHTHAEHGKWTEKRCAKECQITAAAHKSYKHRALPKPKALLSLHSVKIIGQC